MQIEIKCSNCGKVLKIDDINIDCFNSIIISVVPCGNPNCCNCGLCEEIPRLKTEKEEVEKKLRIANNLIEELESDKEKSERIENELAEKLSRAYDVITSLENKSNL